MTDSTHSVVVQIQRLPHAPNELPAYQSDGAVAMDLRLAGDTVTLEPGQRTLLPTGFCVAIPRGYEGQVRMRSGLAMNTGLILPNAPGTIDQDYRGEIRVLVLNAGNQTVSVERGERIAQLVICPVAVCSWQEVVDLPPTRRGENGFGSTGKG
jgi:dUTP pyrophosphatase